MSIELIHRLHSQSKREAVFIRMSSFHSIQRGGDTMEIPSLSMAISQVGVNQQASVSMMQKTMEQAGHQGQALDKLMESAELQRTEHAMQPHLGGSIDVKL